MFQEEGGVGYQYACAAAIQNMNLAAHALGFGSLWFTLFDGELLQTPRKDVKEKTTYIS